ncbi:TerD family protein [Kitasatospora sp. NPDC058965]|uniref:TerD family protein n=1 Tax=Kitasatospora sp. NPDC058965 TaxID=3346682 RepID=UPI00367841D0
MTTALAQGATAPLTAVRVTVEVTARQRLDVVAVLLTSAGRVRSDADLIRRQSPRGPGVLHRPATGSVPQAITVDTWALPRDVTRVLVAANLADPRATFAGAEPTATVRDAATGRVITTFTPPRLQRETALLVVEVHRRGAEWKLRAVGRGYPDGLAGLAAEFGASAEEPNTAADPRRAPAFTPAAVPPPMPAAPPRGTLDKGRAKLVEDGSVALVKQGRPLPGPVRLAVGWAPARPGHGVDLDVSCLAFDARRERLDTAWFMKRSVFDGAVRHLGELPADSPDAEALDLDLAALPTEVCGLVLVVNSFSGQRFTEVHGTYFRLLDPATGDELVRYDLPRTDPHPGLILAKLVRHLSGEWVLTALATSVDAKTARGMVQPASRLL